MKFKILLPALVLVLVLVYFFKSDDLKEDEFAFHKQEFLFTPDVFFGPFPKLSYYRRYSLMDPIPLSLDLVVLDFERVMTLADLRLNESDIDIYSQLFITDEQERWIDSFGNDSSQWMIRPTDEFFQNVLYHEGRVIEAIREVDYRRPPIQGEIIIHY